MAQLREQAIGAFGADHSEKRLCGDNAFAVDFYFPEERTIVEVALGLANPATEFEKDILKAIMAQDLGHQVERLYFISRAGAAKKCGQPGRSALKKWALAKHNLAIEVHELGGEPRARQRRERAIAEAERGEINRRPGPTLEEVLLVTQMNGRVCPLPEFWERLYVMLPGAHGRNGRPRLPNPLILGGWIASDSDKAERLLVHLEVARQYGLLGDVLAFLSSLTEDQWHHERTSTFRT